MEQIDWNKIWEEKIKKASWAQLGAKTDESQNLLWAKHYHKDALWRESRNNQSDWMANKIRLDKKTTLLDIGSGTGVLSESLSRKVKHVTAIEPNNAMLSILKRNILKGKSQNIHYLQKSWEDIIEFIDVNPHDVVLASFSLFMKDIKSALLKMNQLAMRYVCIFTFVGNPVWGYTDLWPKLYGKPYNVGPDYMDLNNVLFSMGICANVEIKWIEHGQSYENMEQAISLWKNNLKIRSFEAEGILSSFLKKHLVKANDRYWSRYPMQSAMVWWSTKNCEPRGPNQPLSEKR